MALPQQQLLDRDGYVFEAGGTYGILPVSPDLTSERGLLGEVAVQRSSDRALIIPHLKPTPSLDALLQELVCLLMVQSVCLRVKLGDAPWKKFSPLCKWARAVQKPFSPRRSEPPEHPLRGWGRGDNYKARRV